MFSKTTIAGRLGRDPQMRETQSGKAITSFSVAVDSGYGEKKSTDWFYVSTFGKVAESCEKYLKKGDLVLVCGRVRLNEFDTKDGTHKASLELLADEVKFIFTGKSEKAMDTTQQVSPIVEGEQFGAPITDDIPF